MKKLHDIDLMEHADGEASSREVEDRLGEDPVARQKIEAVGELGELVRGHLELSADAVPSRRFDAIWREVDKAIERDATEAAPSPTQERAAAGGGVWRRMARWFDQYRGHIITGVVSAGAVATLALVLRTSGGEQGRSASGGGTDHMNTQAISYRPTEIESLDTPGGQGSVFNVKDDEDGSSTTVIWVTPEDTVEGI